MKVEYQGQMVMFTMNSPETAQVMWTRGIIHSIHQTLKADRKTALAQQRPLEPDLPISIITEQHGLVHILRCKFSSWPYFREVEAANPAERFVRAEMMKIGLSGGADRLAQR